MLLIYTHQISSRLKYTVRQVFKNILGIEYLLTSEVSEFVKHQGPKISYTKNQLGSEFFVKSHELLFEQGINDHHLKTFEWNKLPCFFHTSDQSKIPFDFLAASFYLLSRYEEYLPHLKDAHGRFPANESIAFAEGFLKRPVVDLWAYAFLELLLEAFPDLERKKRTYSYKPLIDVSSSHKYKYKGFIRGFFGFFRDLFAFKFGQLFNRAVVILGLKKDPYDNFEFLKKLHKPLGIKPYIFFLFGKYSTYDKNISPYRRSFQHLIKSVADDSIVGVELSYESFSSIERMKHEWMNLSSVIHRQVKSVRMRFNRIEIPNTYSDFADLGIRRDYSMGYTHYPGFRAGSCTPFNFYDIHLELMHPVKVYPFAIQDYSLLKEKSVLDCLKRMRELYEEVKKVDGEYRVLFSNELLGSQMKVNWKKLYTKQLEQFHV
jgi:hypothetical protein